MTEPKWTPGPWQIGAPHGYPSEIKSEEGVIVDFTFTEFGDGTSSANACLIAAAPEVYEALEGMLAMRIEGRPLREWAADAVDRALSVKAKARGETP